ncbi:hypothetical protein PHYC_02033 [Phycisphaerales bacterium]|nr:hypothetical protein PHYC_02033 [Phycisphaerales bacterium]
MRPDLRTVIEQASRHVVLELAPDRLEEFELVFPVLIRTLNPERIPRASQQPLPAGLAFDSAHLADSTLPMTVLAVALLAKAALEGHGSPQPEEVERAERALFVALDKPELVRCARRQVEGVLKEP